MANLRKKILNKPRALSVIIEEKIEEISNIISTLSSAPEKRQRPKPSKDSGYCSLVSSKSQAEIDRMYECDNISELSVSLISDESFDSQERSISSLFSNKSLGDQKDTPKSVYSGNLLPKNLFPNFDEDKVDLRKTSFIDKIETIKNKPCKSLETKKNLLGLVKQYKLLVESRDNLQKIENKTSTLSLTNLHFVKVPRKIGEKLFFLVISNGVEVHISTFRKLTGNQLTFPDEFVFKNCPINFKITVQLYVHTLSARIKSLLQKVVEPFLKRKYSRKDLLKETSTFQLIEEFPISIKDLHSRKTGTLRNSKLYSTSLKVDHLSLTRSKKGYLQIRKLNENDWTRKWCALSGSSFQLFESDLPNCDEDPLNNQKCELFDLRYCSLVKLDLANEMIIITCFKSDDVIEELHIKITTGSPNCANLFLWREALNDVIKTLVIWNQSVLERHQLCL